MALPGSPDEHDRVTRGVRRLLLGARGGAGHSAGLDGRGLATGGPGRLRDGSSDKLGLEVLSENHRGFGRLSVWIGRRPREAKAMLSKK